MRPNSTQAVALVHSKRTLKIINKEIVGIAAVPRLVCTMGTPSCTLLPKMPPMPVMTRPVESCLKSLPPKKFPMMYTTTQDPKKAINTFQSTGGRLEPSLIK